MNEEMPKVDSVNTQEQVSDSNEGEGTVAYANHRRLLGEKKKVAAERDEYRLKYEELQRQNLEREGDKEKQVEFYKSEAESWKQKATAYRENNLKREVRTQVSSIVSESFNQEDAPLVMNLFQSDFGIEKLNVVEEEGDSLKIDKQQVLGALDQLKKSYPSLQQLGRKSIKVHDVKGKPPVSSPKKVTELTKEEIHERLKNL